MFLTEELLEDTSIKEPTMLDETYTARFMGAAHVIINNPVDFRILEHVDPIESLSETNVLFEYKKVEPNTNNVIFSTVVTNIFYPVGTTLVSNGVNMKVTGFGPIVPTPEGKILTISVEVLNGPILLPRTDTSKERQVIDNLNTIVACNRNLKTLLPEYKHDWLDYTMTRVEQIHQYDAMYGLDIFREKRIIEYDYWVEVIKNNIGDPTTLKETLTELELRYSRSKEDSLGLLYYRKPIEFSQYDFILWTLSDETIDSKFITIEVDATLSGGEKINAKDTLTKIERDSNNVVITFTPSKGDYSYRLEMKDVSKIVETFERFVVNEVHGFKIAKSSGDKTEVTLTGKDNLFKAIGFMKVVKTLG